MRKITVNGGGIPTETFISQQPKSHREQKLVSTDCYDNIIQPCNKVYKQADFLVSQIFKKTKDIGEKSLANKGGIPIKMLISQ